jgi:uncharacterized protein (TIGR02271 family)
MYPNNERPERKKPRARVRPPAAAAPLDAVTGEQPLPAATAQDFTMTEPLSSYPTAAAHAGLSSAAPTPGAYAEAATSYTVPGGYAAPPNSHPTAESLAETSPTYPVTHVEPATTYPAAGSYVDTSPSYPVGEAPAATPTTFQAVGSAPYASSVDVDRTLELREEQLVARKDLREVGEITVRTVVEEVPGRLEVEAQREEVEIEHVPVGQIVAERVGPYEEDGVLVVPVYEEQLVVVKRLVLKEHLRVRRVASTEHQLFEDTLRRDRLVIDDPNNTHLVHEQYPHLNGEHDDGDGHADGHDRAEHDEGGPLGQLMRKVLG